MENLGVHAKETSKNKCVLPLNFLPYLGARHLLISLQELELVFGHTDRGRTIEGETDVEAEIFT